MELSRCPFGAGLCRRNKQREFGAGLPTSPDPAETADRRSPLPEFHRSEFLVTPYVISRYHSEHISWNALASGSDRHNRTQITGTRRLRVPVDGRCFQSSFESSNVWWIFKKAMIDQRDLEKCVLGAGLPTSLDLAETIEAGLLFRKPKTVGRTMGGQNDEESAPI